MVRGVEDFGHLSVDGAVGVMAEGGMGVLVLEGLDFGLFPPVVFLVMLTSKLRSRWNKGVVVNAPGRRG